MLKIARGLQLPTDAVAETIGILAKRGSGKSYTAGVIAEEMLEAGIPLCIVDPVGVWWGLRSSADGKHDGYPIVIFGGDHADVPLESTAGRVIADLIIETRIPALIDLSLFSKAKTVQFMVEFSERLYRKNRNPLHLILDEADAFAPQNPGKQGNQQRMLGAVEDIVRRGRARGLGITLITQRSAVLNKNVLTQIEVLVAMRTTSPHDQAAVDSWIKANGTEEQRDLLMGSLASLPVGEAWFWSPGWLKIFKRVKIRKKRTFDSSATPKLGRKVRAPKSIASIDLSAINEKIQSTIEHAAANDPKALQAQIKTLRAENKKLHAQNSLLEKRLARIREKPAAVPASAPAAPNNSHVAELTKIKRIVDRALDLPATATRAAVLKSRSQKAPAAAAEKGLRKGAVRILQELASRYPAGYSKPQVGALTRFSHKGGTFGTYLSDLRRCGYIEERGSLLHASEAGVEFFGGDLPAGPTTHGEAMAQWRNALRAGAYRMLETIVAAGKEGIDRESIAMDVDMVMTGGTFGTYLSDLRRNGLVTDSGGIFVANDVLFPG